MSHTIDALSAESPPDALHLRRLALHRPVETGRLPGGTVKIG
jgi:hypothetical protein